MQTKAPRRTRMRPDLKCPHCSRPASSMTATVENEIPEPGAFSICYACAGICVITDAMDIRKADEEEVRWVAQLLRERGLSQTAYRHPDGSWRLRPNN